MLGIVAAPADCTIQPSQTASDGWSTSDNHRWLQQHCKDLQCENDALRLDLSQLTDRLTARQQSSVDSSDCSSDQRQLWQADRKELEQKQTELQTEIRDMTALMTSQAADHEVKSLALLCKKRSQ